MTDLPKATLETMKKGVVWVPGVLALDAEKSFIEDWQRLVTLYYIRSGARTVIPAAHTGEFAGGRLDLYDRWLRLVAEMVREYGQNMFLMAAVGGPEARRQAEVAAAHGYDVVMVAPTAFGDADDAGAVQVFKDIASVLPAFAFELQRAIPGSREYSASLWQDIFTVACGAKGASFDTYRAQRMLEAAARSPRRDELILATGNDDRIVADLDGQLPFLVDGRRVVMQYDAGLLGHFATDTRAAVRWASAVVRSRDGAEWDLPVPERHLAHYVNMCNGAIFDALGNFENSVWGVKRRLTRLGLLPGPWCFHESGRPGQADAIEAAYAALPLLSDQAYVSDHLSEWKREVGL